MCTAGDAEIHLARRVAKLSRHLPVDKVTVVDRAVARIIGHESGGRVLAVAEAKIIEADPGLHEQRVEAERCRRYVSSSRTDEFGLRTVIARVEAGDAVWVEATLTRVAEIIAPRFPDTTADELRVDRVRLAGPPRGAAGPAPGAPRSAGRARGGTVPADGVHGRLARRVALRRSVGAGTVGPCSTSTFTSRQCVARAA